VPVILLVTDNGSSFAATALVRTPGLMTTRPVLLVADRFLLLSGLLSIGYDHFVIFLSVLTISLTDSSALSPRK
jgi:hypothetical protein